MTDAIRVVLADDHPLVRAGVGATLVGEEDIFVVGEAENGDQAQQLCMELQPDVLVLDLHMPGPQARDIVAYLQQNCPDLKVLVLTAYDDDAYVRGLVAVGVAGYVLKDEVPEAIARAIHAIAQGDRWFSDEILRKLARQKLQPAQADASPLSDRELQIAGLLVAGLTDREIGGELHIAERTVRLSLRNIYDKLAVNTRVEAAVRVTQLGLAVTSEDHCPPLSPPTKPV
ncbi:MAG: response regulator [Anaerolineae bacterium]